MRLLETLLALALSLVLVSGAWSMAAGLRRAAVADERRAAAQDARRVAGLLLDLDAPEAVEGGRPGEISVRAYRWWGVPCAPAGPGRVVARWRGLRGPDATKDSVVVFDASGRRVVRLLGGAGAAGADAACGEDAVVLTWTPGPADEAAVLVRGFERGAYRIDDAFRYRRGLGGAQPLTEAAFEPDSVSLDATDALVRLRARPAPDRWWRR